MLIDVINALCRLLFSTITSNSWTQLVGKLHLHLLYMKYALSCSQVLQETCTILYFSCLLLQGGANGVKGNITVQITMDHTWIQNYVNVKLVMFIISGYWPKDGRLHHWSEGNKPFKICKEENTLFLLLSDTPRLVWFRPFLRLYAKF